LSGWGERVPGGVGFAEGVLLAGGEALGECWGLPDAMLELADQRAGVVRDGAQWQRRERLGG
jgi:hypothetical protein